VKLAMSEACPNQSEYIAAFHALSAAPQFRVRNGG